MLIHSRAPEAVRPRLIDILTVAIERIRLRQERLQTSAWLTDSIVSDCVVYCHPTID